MLRGQRTQAHPGTHPTRKHGRAHRHSNDRHTADASQRSAGAAGCGPPRGVRCHRRANLADPWTVPAPLRGPEPVKPVRAAVVLDPAGQGTAEQVQAGVRRAAHALEQAGYAVEGLEPPGIDAAAKALVIMYATPGLRAVWQQVMPPSLPAATRLFMSAFFEAAGAPIATDIPRKAGTELAEGQVAENLRIMRMAMAVNALGLPAVALPVGMRDGLPQAVQLIGPRYREDLCLDAALALEDQVGIITPIDPS
jgi:amidase